MDLSYILNELGEDRSSYAGSVSPPIFQSSNFCFPTVEGMRQAIADEMDTPFYSRGSNPTLNILRQKVAALAGSEDALLFASGSAAIAAAVMANLQQGDHVVCVQKPYSWTGKLLSKLLERYGVTTSYIEGTQVSEWESSIQANTRLFMLESPNSMTYELQDLQAVTTLAKAHNIITVLDNSYCTPVNQPSIALGIDITTHSGSKYLSGHSDMVAGVLCCNRPMAEKIFKGEYMTLGGILSPQNAWLMLRGLRTLEIRLQRAAESTPKVVAYLEQHPKIEKVLYPFSESFPQYELGQSQMKQPGGMFSILLKTDDLAACERFANALTRFLMACSWGGHESLIFPICALYNSMNYSETPLPLNFVRVYIGLEDPDILIADLDQALAKM